MFSPSSPRASTALQTSDGQQQLDPLAILNLPISSLASLDLPTVNSHVSVLSRLEHEFERRGDYLSAEQCHNRLEQYKGLEANRKQDSLRLRHESERRDVDECELEEINEFHSIWDRKFQHFDEETKAKVENLKGKHLLQLEDWTREQQEKMLSRPKFSKILLDLRSVEESLARGKKYAQAAKVQRQADLRQAAEIEQLRAEWLNKILLKKDRLLKQQNAELDAFSQRRAADREILIKQRNSLIDSTIVQKFRNLKQELQRQQNKEVQFSMKVQWQSENIQKIKLSAVDEGNINQTWKQELEARPKTAAVRGNPYGTAVVQGLLKGKSSTLQKTTKSRPTAGNSSQRGPRLNSASPYDSLTPTASFNSRDIPTISEIQRRQLKTPRSGQIHQLG